jgi:XTP/dITP diphosphohydrolase
MQQTKKRLLVATRNPGKAKEFQRMLHEAWIVMTLLDRADAPQIAEDGLTFEENALKKACGISALGFEWVMADDSGLEVEALNGAPGVYSARYAGSGASDAANLKKLLDEMKDIPSDRRKARFRCVLVLSRKDVKPKIFEGVCQGRMALEVRGSGGFGYDPAFIPDGFDRTFGELESAIKDTISHRASALRQAAAYLAGVV